MCWIADTSTHTLGYWGIGAAGQYSLGHPYQPRACCLCAGGTNGAICNLSRTDPQELEDFSLQAHGTRVGFPKAESCDGTVLEIPCDVLIPAAIEKQLMRDNTRQVQVKITAEAGNGPTTPAAHEIFLQRNILIIPDLYVNTGGVTVSFFKGLKSLNLISYSCLSFRRERESSCHLLLHLSSVWARPGEISIVPTPSSRPTSSNHGHGCKAQPGPGPETCRLAVRSGDGVHRVG
ncbi:glutamate dehydrogenase 2, mitochondrial-like [Apteryx mantelli]|uniref:Glutamate dehydrogenase 2, mitochondrial-like n=1 Tax=Apteryx mantelli TaxID=2696672 RepID=A0ABM4F883_9AVES